MGKKRTRSQRQERHAARQGRLRVRQSSRRQRQRQEAFLHEAMRQYQNALLQAMLCEYIALQGEDPYADWVVCEKCGLAQVYKDDQGGEEDDIHNLIYQCPGFLEIGCGSEMCITVAHYLEEAA